jgi:hypothetical protein
MRMQKAKMLHSHVVPIRISVWLLPQEMNWTVGRGRWSKVRWDEKARGWAFDVGAVSSPWVQRYLVGQPVTAFPKAFEDLQ